MSSSRRSSSSSSREGHLDERIGSAGYGHVVFRDYDQKKRFVELMGRPIVPTRFLDREALSALGLKRDMRDMLTDSGCPGLYKMCEHTYESLTLEFLSSYYYDQEEPAVGFRLFNKEKFLYPKKWAKAIGCWCGEGKEKSLTEPRENAELLWKALTGLPYGDHGWRFKSHLIQHPVLRIWSRLIGNTYFARPEPTNMKQAEIQMLFSYLNIDGGEPFQVDIGHYVAKHLESVTNGTIGQIMVGGLITHIAKKQFKSFDESRLEPVLGSSSSMPPTMDLTNLSRMRYIKRSQAGDLWWWKIGTDFAITLPEEGETRQIRRVVPTPPSHELDMSYYLVGETEAAEMATDDDDDVEPGIPLIEPQGDYSQFQHYPFSIGPYNPEGYNLTQLPETFATYPPFDAPPVWTNQSRDAMLFGLCNQIQQVHLDNSIANHHLYSYHVNQGNIASDAIHPAYYVPPLEFPATNDDQPEHSNAQSRGNFAALTGREGVDETSD